MSTKSRISPCPFSRNRHFCDILCKFEVLTKKYNGVKIYPNKVAFHLKYERRFIMDQITAIFEGIDWNGILDTVMNKLTDLIVQIDFQKVLDALGGLIGSLLG